MAYLASSDIKDYGGIPATDTADDAELTAIIARAQTYIEEYTGRVFSASSASESTHYFTVGQDTGTRILWLDGDLNTLGSNGITIGSDTLATTDYTTRPRNARPYYAIKLNANSPLTWDNPTSDGDYEDAITVSGQWAYSSDVPNDIKQAMLRLVKWYYKQGRVTDEVADRPIITESGVVVMPSQIPADITEILERYRYRPVAS